MKPMYASYEITPIIREGKPEWEALCILTPPEGELLPECPSTHPVLGEKLHSSWGLSAASLGRESLGRSRYRREYCATLDEAREYAERFVQEVRAALEARHAHLGQPKYTGSQVLWV